MAMIKYLGLADFLLIAEAALQVPAEDLHRVCDIGAADSALKAPAACFGDYEAYPSMAQKTAVLAARLCRNHASSSSATAIPGRRRWAMTPKETRPSR